MIDEAKRTGTRKQARKRVHIPAEGDFLTDGTRLVEVVGKCREGYSVIDTLVEVEDLEDTSPEVLHPMVVQRRWRPVTPMEEVA